MKILYFLFLNIFFFNVSLAQNSISKIFCLENTLWETKDIATLPDNTNIITAFKKNTISQEEEFAIIKLDPLGKLIWVKIFVQPNYWTHFKVISLSDNSFLILGTPPGGFGAKLARFDTDGKLIWSKKLDLFGKASFVDFSNQKEIYVSDGWLHKISYNGDIEELGLFRNKNLDNQDDKMVYADASQVCISNNIGTQKSKHEKIGMFLFNVTTNKIAKQAYFESTSKDTILIEKIIVNKDKIIVGANIGFDDNYYPKANNNRTFIAVFDKNLNFLWAKKLQLGNSNEDFVFKDLSIIDDDNLLVYFRAGNSLAILNESKYIIGKFKLSTKSIDSTRIIGKSFAFSSQYDTPVKVSSAYLYSHIKAFKDGFGLVKNSSVNNALCNTETIKLSETLFSLLPVKDSIYLPTFGKGGISDFPFYNIKDITINEYSNCIDCGCPKIESENRDFCQDETFKLPSGKTFVISKDTLLIDTLFNNMGCSSYYKLQTKVLLKKTQLFDKTLCKSIPSIKIASKNYTKAGIYQDTLKTVTGCDSFLTINIKDLSVSLGEDKEILEGDKVKLEAKTNDGQVIDNYTWLPQGTTNCDTCQFVNVRPNKNQWYSVKVIKGGCIVRDSILIKVLNQKLVYMPNVFSPNDDKINDLYRPYCAEGVVEIEYFQVFDRWGTLIYDAQNYDATDTSIGWDGTYKNTPANRDVYTYTLQVRLRNGQTQKYLGDVFLLRE